MGHENDHVNKDKFADARAILELRDSVTIGNVDFIISTLMLADVKVVNSQRYWFETYLFELVNGQPLGGKIISQYTNAHDAVQGHKAIALGFIPAVLKTKDLTEAIEAKKLSEAKVPECGRCNDSVPCEQPENDSLVEEITEEAAPLSIEADPAPIPGRGRPKSSQKKSDK